MSRRRAKLALGAACVVAVVATLLLGDGQTLITDQWAYLNRYRDWDLETLLRPHNGHLIVLPLLVYKAEFELFGIASHVPYLLTVALLSALVASLLFALLRDAIGDLLALAAAVLALFYGAGGEAIVIASQIPNLIGIAAGLAMLLALRRDDRRGDLAACLLLAISLASFSVGAAFAAGAAAHLALRPAGRRLAGAWVVAAPLALFVAWYVWSRRFGHAGLDPDNVRFLGSAVADQLGLALTGITGLFPVPSESGEKIVPVRFDWGPALALGLAALLYLRLRRPPRPGAPALAAAAVLVAYFVLVGMALHPYRNTFDIRYVYLSSILVLVAVPQLLGPYRPNRPALVAIGVVFGFSLLANGAQMIRLAEWFEERSAVNRAKLTAVDLAVGGVPPNLLVEPPGNDMVFRVYEWRRLKERYGSPAYSEPQLRAAREGARRAADAQLVYALGIHPVRRRPARAGVPAPPAPAPTPIGSEGGEVLRSGRCLLLRPERGVRMAARLRLAGGGLEYASGPSPVRVVLGRFGDRPSVALPPRGGRVEVAIPADRSDLPWEAELRTAGPARVCSLP